MNVVGKFGLGLATALMLNLGVHAAPVIRTPALPNAADSDSATAPAADSSSQPYATIVARNIFGLVPVPPPPPPPGPPEDPPPKITANGIMSVFGELQALFKVTEPGKAGQPPKDQSYMLSEGQRQDDIEVVKIDVKAATITFNNHGTEQEIPLEAAKDSGPSGGMAMPAVGGPPPGGGGFNPAIPRFRPRPGMPNEGLAPGAAGGPFQPQSNNGNNDNPAGLPFTAGGNNGGGVDVAQQAAENTSGLTPEQQAILIETERLANEQKVTEGSFPIAPPTPLTPANTTGPTGEPLVHSPQEPEHVK